LLGRTRRVHFVGIGGIGMSGIAELLANLGYVVSGSDERRTPLTDRLAVLGIRIAYEHDPAAVADADVVVVSSAVRSTNDEVREAVRRHIPVIPRAEMLAELMRLRFSIAVAGAHGKTTTTSMIALMLERAGLDPTAVIGGKLSAFGGGARLGRGELMVAEADESDRSFLKLFPTIAVVTNIDHEHLENYGSFGELQQAFVDFANKVPFYGSVIACADDPYLAEILPNMTRRVVTYGLTAPRSEIAASDVNQGTLSVEALVSKRGADTDVSTPLGRLSLEVPGRHNLQNALAAVAVGLELGLPFERIAAGLGAFRGVERRFEVCGEAGGVLVINDYGHHPTEIAAVLEAARAFKRRIIVAFQPHRFTRTAALMDDFGPALAAADHIVLTGIYPAGEDPIPDVTIEKLAATMRRTLHVPVEIVPLVEDVVPALVRIARPGDLVITLGAGSIGGVAEPLIAALSARTAAPGGIREAVQ
jgi:UDP-N-acetylmuramate--alanine ligase